jgi:hypothetical protein
MKYELTFKDGTKAIVKADNISEAITGMDVVKVEELDAKELKTNKGYLSSALSNLGRTYLSAKNLASTIANLIYLHGFTVNPDDIDVSGAEGQKTLDIGKGQYLHYTWYCMGSGNYEFVGYLTT